MIKYKKRKEKIYEKLTAKKIRCKEEKKKRKEVLN